MWGDIAKLCLLNIQHSYLEVTQVRFCRERAAIVALDTEEGCRQQLESVLYVVYEGCILRPLGGWHHMYQIGRHKKHQIYLVFLYMLLFNNNNISVPWETWLYSFDVSLCIMYYSL